jgi:hypothetical protein
MAYWGGAMTHDAPLQGPRGVQDTKAGQAILSRIDPLQARAAAALGRGEEAVRFYRDLLDIWKSADADLPALKEAQDYVERSGG